MQGGKTRSPATRPRNAKVTGGAFRKTVHAPSRANLQQQIELRTRAGHAKPITAYFFPAYDDDGGLLVALTPR